ncbi:hypothetical protein [Micromonospora sp. WMMC273]|uniref:hypothetical protein n=1 Tax=Micromonospora sp. WMMC273 TaxID=3015157 RepID=UPI0022B616D7|nr:hypothetical protein [Micromonospora sp. WMMC273]MCZ7478844.1 hypothetical protein [Micromonospora sp. WMMC273]
MRKDIGAEQARHELDVLLAFADGLTAPAVEGRLGAPLRRPPGVDLPEVPPTRFTAADVPRLRDRLLEHWEVDGGLRVLFGMHNNVIRTPWLTAGGRPVRPMSRWEYEQQLRRWLAEAELFFVTSDMTTVARQAAEAMPNYEVNADTMPARVGFCVWADAMSDVRAHPDNDLRPGERCVLQAVLWAETMTPEGPGVQLVTLQLSDVMLGTRLVDPEEVAASVRVLGPLCYHEEYELPYGNRPFGAPEGMQVGNTAVGAVMSTWLMMSQRITDVQKEPLPRSVRRAYTRQGRPEPVVRTVTLRRAASAAQEREPGQESSRVYTKQWVVRGYGYWRNTWYPSKGEHRQQFVYVPDYVKGPAGAPLVGGERVSVLRR